MISLKDLREDRWWNLETASCGEIRLRLSKTSRRKRRRNRRDGFSCSETIYGYVTLLLVGTLCDVHSLRWCKFEVISRRSVESYFCVSCLNYHQRECHDSSQETRDLLWGGLPSSMRRNSWFILSGADRVKCESKRTYVNHRLSFNINTHTNTNRYESYLQDQVDASVRDAVEADCVRTFTSHSTSLDKNVPRNVLLAHASRSPQIGYAQGLNHIVGFIMSMSEFPERDTFWILSALTGRLCEDYYTKSMFGLS